MLKAELGNKLRHHEISEMFPMVCKNGLWYTKPSNDMIKNKKGICFISVIICRHRFGPFGKVIHRHNDVAMPTSQVRVTCHRFNAPFFKRSNSDNMM